MARHEVDLVAFDLARKLKLGLPMNDPLSQQARHPLNIVRVEVDLLGDLLERACTMIDLLQEWVGLQARRCPEAVALVQGDRAMTYGRLDRPSNQLARALRAAGCRRGDRVSLLVPKSPEAVAGMLGTLKADCIYVLIDPANPAARVAKILDACDSRCLLTASPALGLLGQVLADEKFGGDPCVGLLIDGRHMPSAEVLKTGDQFV